jgi:hypothetical protein
MKISSALRSASFFVALSLLPISVQAQLLKGYGAKVGINSATSKIDLTLAGSENSEIAGKRRAGINAALFVEGLKLSFVSVLAQVEYAQRGFVEEQQETGLNGENLDIVRASSRLDYVSLPVLIKLQPSVKSVSPFVIFGPRFDFLVNREAGKYRFTSVTIASSSSELFNDHAFGGTVGVGLAASKFWAVPVFVEVRYNFDFTDNIDLETLRAKNNAVDVWLGIGL